VKAKMLRKILPAYKKNRNSRHQPLRPDDDQANQNRPAQGIGRVSAP